MMKKPWLTGIAALALKARCAAAAELPTFELMGFPISLHEMSVLRSARVQEQSAAPVVFLAAMPASPHQPAVLMPHPRITNASANSTKATSAQ
jgi:hypothetical protein